MDSIPLAIRTSESRPLTEIVFSKRRWTKHEEVRLICCLLETDSGSLEGRTYLEFLKGCRSRTDLDRDQNIVIEGIGKIFNDKRIKWSQYTTVSVVQKYNPCNEDFLNLPRKPSDIVKHFKTTITEQLKSFTSAFRQSGRGSFDDWDFQRWHIAHFMYEVVPDMLQLLVGAVLTTTEEAAMGFADFTLGGISYSAANDVSLLSTSHIYFVNPSLAMRLNML